MTDPTNRTTTTTYTPHNAATNATVKMTVTRALGLVDEVEVDRGRGVTLKSKDANGKETTTWYDAFGRVINVFLPGDPVGAAASYAFEYGVRGQNAVSYQRSYQAHSISGGTAQYSSSFSLYDGFLRVREVQSRAADLSANQVVVGTFYDDHGRAVRTTEPVVVAGAEPWIGNPPHAVYTNSAFNYGVESRVTYDQVGRPTRSGRYLNGALDVETVTTYDGYTTRVNPPGDAGDTIETTDAFGQVVSRTDGVTPTSAGLSNLFEYDKAGRVTNTRTPAANGGYHDATATYDWQGNKTSTTDPDAGNSTIQYDLAGRVTLSTSPFGTVWHGYDAVGRETSTRGSSSTGQLLSELFYDPAGNKGMLEKTRSYVPNGAGGYDVVEAKNNSFDGRYRVTSSSVTVPASVAGPAAGTFTTNTTFGNGGQVLTQTFPAGFGLPAETITSTYKANGTTDTVTSSLGTVLLRDIKVSPQGRFDESRSSSGADEVVRSSWRDSRHRTYRDRVSRGGVALKDDWYSFDAADRVKQVGDVITNEQACYIHDEFLRLTRAWSTTNSACNDSSAPNNAGVAAPFNRGWTYNGAGGVVSMTESVTGPPAVTSWAYGNTSKPRFATSVGANSYTVGSNGATSSQVVGGVTSNYSWNYAGKPVSITSSNGDSETNTFTASGSRVVRKTVVAGVSTWTVFAAGQELTATQTGVAAPVLSGRRFFSGAFRDSTAGIIWTAADTQGTSQGEANSTTGAVARRRNLPFGVKRDGNVTSGHGFLGAPENTGTGLTLLGARMYDPVKQTFISTDPLLVTRTTQLSHPYGYSGNDPINSSDPTGMDPAWAHDNDPCNDMAYYECDDAGKVTGPGRRQIEENRQRASRQRANTPQGRALEFARDQYVRNGADPYQSYLEWLNQEAVIARGMASMMRSMVDPCYRSDLSSSLLCDVINSEFAQNAELLSTSVSEFAHFGLAVLGMVPAAGAAADAADAGLYAIEGKWGEAAFSAVAAVPAIGDAAAAVKIGRNVNRLDNAVDAARATEAATSTRVVIGGMEDLGSGSLRAGEEALFTRLPGDTGSRLGNWLNNRDVLRAAMRDGAPIRDASVDSAGNLLYQDTRRFITMERDYLRSFGWTYDPSTSLWMPPG